jgi:hypothetical protein
MMGGLQTEILILRRQQLNVLRRNTGGPRQDEKYRYQRGLAFLIFALVALPVIRVLIPDQPAGAISPNIESHAGAGCKRASSTRTVQHRSKGGRCNHGQFCVLQVIRLCKTLKRVDSF